MRKLYPRVKCIGFALTLMLTFIVLSFTANAQIPVTVTNSTNTTPNLAASYPSLSSALTALNSVTAMSGPVTLTLSTGSETAPAAGLALGSASLNAVLSATNTITIVKGAGQTPVLNAGVGVATGAGSATPDGMLKLTGADYVTIDGLTLTDGNTTTATVAMEYGIALFKLSATDGCNNNTIQNCTINMQRINNSTATSPMLDGAVGILVINSTSTTATTSITPTAASGTNSNNKFYSNTINGGNIGIGLSGYAATTGYPLPALGDVNNDIGGAGAAAATTGNTILNYGGGASTNPAAGIRANNQWGLNISNNTINNNNGAGVNHATTLRGIYAQAGTSANVTISYNTVTVKSGATTSALTAIDNAIGSTANSNTVNITNNTVQNCTYATGTSATFSGISSSASATTVNINNNTVQNNTFTGATTTGTFNAIINSGTNTTTNCNNNQVLNNTIGTNGTGSSCTFLGVYCSATSTNYNANANTVSGNILANSYGTIYCIRGTTSTIIVTGNTISNNTIPNSAGATSSNIYGYYDVSSPVLETITNNIINNLSITGASTATGHGVYGIYNNTAAGAKVFSGNKVDNLSFTSSGSGYATVAGIRNLYASTSNIFKNVIHSLSSTGASPLVAGLYLGSGTITTINAYNNIIGNLSTPASTGANLHGIYVGSSGTDINLYYNTIYLNATSTGTGFGSSAVYMSSTTPVVTLKNNILINLSTATGTGLTTVIRRTSATLSSYGASSDNNLLYAGSPSSSNVIYYDGTTGYPTFGPAATAGTYQNLVTPRDQASFTGEPAFDYTLAGSFFQSLTGSSATFLHLVPGITTQAEGGAIPIGSPSITDDFDGNVRNATKPDVGADEFVGVSPAPVITLNSVTPPATTQCAAVSRAISVNVTTPSGTITGVTITYNNGSSTTTSMTNSGGSTWTYTIPAASPSTTTVTWSITATNSLGINKVYSGTSYTDDPLNGASAVSSASINPVCSGSPTVLSVVTTKTGDASLGAGGTTVGSTAGSNPFYGGYGGVKTQYIIRASELTAIGILPGNINSLAMELTSAGSTLTGFAINMEQTALTVLTSSIEAVNNNVYSNPSFVPVVGINTFTFSSPFVWDGTSNIIISFCWSNANTSNTVSSIKSDVTTFVAGNARYVDSKTDAEVCGYTGSALPSGWNGASTTVSTRPKFIFNGTVTVPMSTFSWSDGTSTVGTTNPLTINPTSTKSYTATATDGNGCSVVAPPLTVNVTSLPSSPTAGAPSTQCGNGIPSVAVTSTTGQPTPTFKWYSAAVGGTLLQTGTSTTYTTSISATTTFYVAELVGSCESNRVAVTANVNQPDAVSAKVNNSTTPPNGCPNTQITLTAANTAGSPTNTYVYSWTASPVSGSGIPTNVAGATANITPTAPGTYVYTVSASDGATLCNTTATVTYTVVANPVITTPTASATTVCSGGATTLSSQTLINGSATNTIGTDNAASKINTTGVPYRTGTTVNNQVRSQYLVLASELTSAGMVAGNISSLSFVVTTGGGGVMSGLTFKVGATAATSMTTSYLAPSFTTVLTLATFTPVLGTNTHNFTTPYTWDGTSNIVVEVCGTLTTGGSGCTMATYTTGVNTTIGNSSATGCSDATGTTTALTRPVMIFSQAGAGTLTWLWTPGNLSGNTVTVNPVTPGVNTYTVKGTNGAGCFSTATVDVTVAPLTATATKNPTAAVCQGTSVTLDVTVGGGAPFTYVWKNAANATLGTTKSISVTPNAPGDTYTVTVTDACSNTTTSSIAVVVNPNPTANVTPGGPIALCTPATSLLTVTTDASSASYQWKNNTTNIPSETNSTYTVSASGSYSVVVTNTNTNCVTTSNAVVATVTTSPTVSASATSNAICAGSSIDLNATSPSTVSTTVFTEGFESGAAGWTFLDFASTGTNLPAQLFHIETAPFTDASGSATFSNFAITGTKFAYSTPDAGGSGSQTNTALVSPSFSTMGYTGAATLSFKHVYRRWASSSPAEQVKVQISTDGTTWTDLQNYSAADVGTITNNAQVAVAGNVTVPASYMNQPSVMIRFYFASNWGYFWAIDDVSLVANSPVSYSWTSSPAGFTSSTQNPTTITPASTTTYTVTVTGTAGCTGTASTSVTVDPVTVGGSVAGAQAICSGTQPSTDLVLSGQVGSVQGWESSPNASFAIASPITSTSTTLTGATIGNLTQDTYFRAVVKSGTCNVAYSTSVLITVKPIPAMTSAAAGTICSGVAQNYTLTSNVSGATFSWSRAAVVGISNTALTGQATNPITEALVNTTSAPIDVTYALTPSANGCTGATFNYVVTVNAASVGGTVASPQTVCIGSAPSSSIVLSGNTGSVVKWQKASDAAFTSPNDINITSATLSNISMGQLTQNTYFRAVVQSASCATANSASVLMTVNSTVDNTTALAGTAGGGQVCATYDVAASNNYMSNCNLIATVAPRAGTPISGVVNACVMVEAGVLTAPNGQPYVARHFDILPATNRTTATSTMTLYFKQAEFTAYNAARGVYPALPTGSGDATGIANLRVTLFNTNGVGTSFATYPALSGKAIVPTSVTYNATADRWSVVFAATGSGAVYVHTGAFALPVTLVSFKGEQSGEINKLTWSTATETNNKGFELERSLDGIKFTSIAFVASKGDNGNSSVNLDYGYNDKAVVGVTYYRLKQVDRDGKYNYSNVVTLTRKGSEIVLSSVYPNPATFELNLKITSPRAEKLTIVVTDLTGKVVMQRAASVVTGDNIATMNVSALAAGSYIIKAICANGCETAVHKFVKQ